MTAKLQLFSRGRRLGIRITAVLGLLLFTFFFAVVAADAMDLVQPGAEGSPSDPPPSRAARVGAAHPGEAVHVAGALSVLAIGVSGLTALIIRPERTGSAYQVLAAMIGVLITLPIVGDPDNVGGQAGWIDPLLLVLVFPSIVAAALAMPWGRRRSGAGRRRFLALAAIGAIPAAVYGVNQALMQRDTFPPTADPHHNAHWWAMAVAAFVVILVTAAAAFPGRGWGLGALIGTASPIAFGLASIVDQSAASALPIGWAVASVVWGSVGVSLTVQAVRHTDLAERDRATAPPSGDVARSVTPSRGKGNEGSGVGR